MGKSKKSKPKFLKLSNEGLDRIAYNLHEFQIIPETREIFLHRHIHDESGDTGEGCGTDYRSATRFIKNLRLLNAQGNENILVHMHSRGGDWFDGMATYDAIIASPSPIVILAYAHARSMTSIIIQAAKVRVMMPSSIFLLHEGFTESCDRIRASLTWAEQDKEDLEIMLGVYAKRCRKAKPWRGMTKMEIEKAILAKMRQYDDWILSPSQAVMYGFVDGILGRKGFESLSVIRAKADKK